MPAGTGPDFTTTFHPGFTTGVTIFTLAGNISLTLVVEASFSEGTLKEKSTKAATPACFGETTACANTGAADRSKTPIAAAVAKIFDF